MIIIKEELHRTDRAMLGMAKVPPPIVGNSMFAKIALRNQYHHTNILKKIDHRVKGKFQIRKD